MYRTVVIAVIALGVITVPVETSLAFGRRGVAHFGQHTAAVKPAARHVAPTLRRGVGATPRVKKLSPKAAWACYRACMHGLDASWDNFCAVSCD